MRYGRGRELTFWFHNYLDLLSRVLSWETELPVFQFSPET